MDREELIEAIVVYVNEHSIKEMMEMVLEAILKSDKER